MEFERDLSFSAERTSVHRLLGPDDVAKWLGVSSGWVRDHATRKVPRLKAVKVGKLLRFRPEDVETFIRAGLRTSLVSLWNLRNQVASPHSPLWMLRENSTVRPHMSII